MSPEVGVLLTAVAVASPIVAGLLYFERRLANVETNTKTIRHDLAIIMKRCLGAPAIVPACDPPEE